MAKRWIKLWTDLLHDYKVTGLPEFLQMRFVKLLLLAAEKDDEGRLPSVMHIAHGWELTGARVEQKTLESLSALVKVGVIGEDQQGWFVVAWSKRQALSESAERTRKWRERKRHGHRDRHGDVAYSSSSFSDSVSDSFSDSLKTQDSLKNGEIFRLYENEIGILTPMIADSIQDGLGDYPDEWIRKAIGEAAAQNKRSWAYVEAILKRWKVEGPQTRKKNQDPYAPSPAVTNEIREQTRKMVESAEPLLISELDYE